MTSFWRSTMDSHGLMDCMGHHIFENLHGQYYTHLATRGPWRWWDIREMKWLTPQSSQLGWTVLGAALRSKHHGDFTRKKRPERDRFTNQLINSSCFFLPITPSAVILHGVYVRERNDTSHPRYARLEHRKIVLLNKGTTIFQKANQMDNDGTGTRHQFNLYT